MNECILSEIELFFREVCIENVLYISQYEGTWLLVVCWVYVIHHICHCFSCAFHPLLYYLFFRVLFSLLPLVVSF